MAIRLTESRLRQIIREEASRINSSRNVREAYGMHRNLRNLDNPRSDDLTKMPSKSSIADEVKKLEFLFGTDGLTDEAQIAIEDAEANMGFGGSNLLKYPEVRAILGGGRDEMYWHQVLKMMMRRKSYKPASRAFAEKYPELAGLLDE